MRLKQFLKNNFSKITILLSSMAVVGMFSFTFVTTSLCFDRIKELESENNKLESALESSDSILESYANSNTELKGIIDQLSEQQEELISDNKKLNSKNNKYLKTIKKFQEREELFDKYEYAIVTDGYRTDLTYDQIKNGEELMLEKGYDPNLLFGIIMVESSADEKLTSDHSTARGYGQILKGTGEFVYSNLLNLGKYNHNMAFDGNTNIMMMCEYLDYLIKRRDNDLYKAIQGYRGKTDVSGYIRGIDKYITQSNTSIDEISKAIAKNK